MLSVSWASDVDIEWRDSGLSLLQHGAAKLPSLHAAPPWAGLDEVPGSCLPKSLVPRYGRCLFGYQCVTGFCSPFLRVCLESDEDNLPRRAVRADGALWRIMWQSCKGRHKDCRTCEFSPRSLEDFEVCSEDPFSPGRPSLSLFDPSDPTCGCHEDFVSHYRAETWVDCSGGGGQASVQAQQVARRLPSPPCESAGKSCAENLECSAALKQLEGLRLPADRLSDTFALCEHKEAFLLLLGMWTVCPLPDGADPTIRQAIADFRAEATEGSIPEGDMCSFVGVNQLRLVRLLPQTDRVDGADLIRQLNPARRDRVLAAERSASRRFIDQIHKEVLFAH